MHRVVAIVIVALAVALAVGYRVWTADRSPEVIEAKAESTTAQSTPTTTSDPIQAPPPEATAADVPHAEPISPATPATQESLVRIDGIVVERETSRPVSGAIVVAYEGGDWSSSEFIDLSSVSGMVDEVFVSDVIDNVDLSEYEPKPWEFPEQSREHLGETKAGADGTFSIEIAVGKNTYVECTAPGFALTYARVASGGNALRVSLSRAGAIHGRVVDARTSAPLSGIEMAASRRQSMDEMMESMDVGAGDANSTRTDDRGEYEINGLAVGAYTVYADGQSLGYLPQSDAGGIVNVEPGGDHEALEIRLERGGFVFGSVKDDKGNPLEHASFDVTATNSADITVVFDFDRPEPGSWSEVHDDGTFRLGALEYGVDYRIKASAANLAPNTQSIRLPEGRDVGPLTFVLKPGGKISGMVRYQSGEPAEQGMVVLHPDGTQAFDWTNGMNDNTMTSDSGTFLFENVADGAYRVTAFGVRNFSQDEVVSVEMINARDVSGLELVIASRIGEPESSDPITGTVIDANGRPVAGIEVRATEVGGFPDATASTDEKGAFSLAATPQFGGGFTLEAVGDAGYKRLTGIHPGSAVRMRLGPSSKVAGVVVNQHGQPVADCRVTLQGESRGGMMPFGRAEDSATTGTDGAFEFRNMEPGEYYIEAKTQTQGTGKSDSFNVAEGRSAEDIKVVVLPGARLAGRVLDPNGRPLSRAQVRLIQADSGPFAAMAEMMPDEFTATGGAATTDDRGEFLIPDVAPGTYTAVATYPQYAKAKVPNITLESGDFVQGIDLMLSVGGGASGVYLVDGQPKGSVSIQLIGPGGVHMVTTDAEGRFDITGLPAGSYMVSVMDFANIDPSDGMSAFTDLFPQSVEIVDGQISPIDFTPPEGVAVNGSIAALGLGENAMVRLRTPEGVSLSELDFSDPLSMGLDMIAATSGFGEVAADGHFVIDNVEPGAYVLEIYREPDPSTYVPSDQFDVDMIRAYMPVLVHAQEITVGEEPITLQIGAQTGVP